MAVLCALLGGEFVLLACSVLQFRPEAIRKSCGDALTTRGPATRDYQKRLGGWFSQAEKQSSERKRLPKSVWGCGHIGGGQKGLEVGAGTFVMVSAAHVASTLRGCSA